VSAKNFASVYALFGTFGAPDDHSGVPMNVEKHHKVQLSNHLASVLTPKTCPTGQQHLKQRVISFSSTFFKIFSLAF